MRIFNSHYANIDVLKGKVEGNGVRLTWLGFAKENEYIDALQMVLDLYKEHHLEYLILNQTNMKVVTPDALNWTKEHFIDPISSNNKKVIIKKAMDIFGALPTNEIIAGFSKNNIDLSIHEDLEAFNRELENLFLLNL